MRAVRGGVAGGGAPLTGPPAGADGCRRGWVVALGGGGEPPDVVVVPTFADVLGLTGGVVAVDMPIGLPDSGRRACDAEARRLLGPRRSSVFPVPVRPQLGAASFADVTGLSLQAWHLLPKIREVDEAWEPRVVECSPELSLAVVTGAPMAHPKRTPEGREERHRALSTAFPGLRTRAPGAAPHDVLDAHACLLTARRVEAGEAISVGDGSVDARGRPQRVFA